MQLIEQVIRVMCRRENKIMTIYILNKVNTNLCFGFILPLQISQLQNSTNIYN
jgi:hypothetical protein